MNELTETNVIRLQTELENAIGHRDHYAKIGDSNLYEMWDRILDEIIDEIMKLGEMK